MGVGTWKKEQEIQVFILTFVRYPHESSVLAGPLRITAEESWKFVFLKNTTQPLYLIFIYMQKKHSFKIFCWLKSHGSFSPGARTACWEGSKSSIRIFPAGVGGFLWNHGLPSPSIPGPLLRPLLSKYLSTEHLPRQRVGLRSRAS